MADKVLKGMKFPGLEDTYYVPESVAVEESSGHVEIQSYISDGSTVVSGGVGEATADGGEIFNDYDNNTAGNYAHAEGYETTASGEASHAEGRGTKASSADQHAQGKYNIEDANGTYAHIVGNGTSTNARSNAHTLDWDGNAWFAGNVSVGSNAKVLATQEYVNTNAAPAGYGLGETLFDSNKYIMAAWGESFESYCAQIDARLEEMDNYSFRFVLARGIAAAPNPYENTGNVMAVLYRGASANAGQLIALASEGSRPMWRMSKTSGVWSDIEWFDPPMYSGVAYRTTKRVGNLPVYVASFSGGEIPSAGGERWIGLPIAEYWDGTEGGWYERTVSSVLSIKGCIDDTIANYYTLDDSRIVNGCRIDWGGTSTGTLVIDYNSTALSFIRETAGDSSVVPTVTIRVEFAGY